MSEVLPVVTEVIRSHSPQPVDNIDPALRIRDGLEVDSFILLDILLELEEKFEIQIPDEQVQEIETVRELAELVERIFVAKPAVA